MKTNIRKAMVLWVALIGLILLLPFNSHAQTLQPRLLWEKKLPFTPDEIKMASISGDVLVWSQDARQIILYDKNGNKVFHWGPRVDRQPMGVDISDDGSVIIYETSFTESYIDQKKPAGDWDWDGRIHYSTRKGKELWNKKIWGSATLSPDGKMVVNHPSVVATGDLYVYDSQGKLLWTFETSHVDALSFSPDSQYLGFYSSSGIQSKSDGYYFMDKSGNVLWVKADVFSQRSTLSDMAKYVFINTKVGPNEVGKVYDKQGNLVFEGDVYLSGDGNRLFVRYPNKMVLMSLPDKSVIKEYPSWRGFMSHDGRFLVTRGVINRDNTLVIDTLQQVESEILTGKHTNFMSTKDARYMAVVVDGNKILYYQLY